MYDVDRVWEGQSFSGLILTRTAVFVIDQQFWLNRSPSLQFGLRERRVASTIKYQEIALWFTSMAWKCRICTDLRCHGGVQAWNLTIWTRFLRWRHETARSHTQCWFSTLLYCKVLNQDCVWKWQFYQKWQSPGSEIFIWDPFFSGMQRRVNLRKKRYLR